MSRYRAAVVLSLLALCLTTGQAKTLNQRRGEENQVLRETRYRDCHERWESGETVPGVYTIHPNATHPVKVYCNHSTEATFAVIQRRAYGTENFNRDWNSYKLGFGTVQGDHWIGLDAISLMTSSGTVNLRIDLHDWSTPGQVYTIYYIGFYVQPESGYYRMTYKSYSGSLPNDLAFNNGQYFYTPDRPDTASCAVHQKCGWWFNPQNQCTFALLNGVYYHGGPYHPTGQYYDGIYYKDWHGYAYSMKFVTMSLYK